MYLQHSAEILNLNASSFVNASLLEECLLLHWFVFSCLQPIEQIHETTSMHFIIKLSPRYCYCSCSPLVKALKEETQLLGTEGPPHLKYLTEQRLKPKVALIHSAQ